MVQTLVEAEQQKNILLVINLLSALLKRMTNQNDELTVSQQYRRHPPSVAKAFSTLVLATISIRNYLKHIFLNTNCSTCCHVIAFIYLDRFLYFNPSVRLDSFNVHRFLITAIHTSVKFMDGRLIYIVGDLFQATGFGPHMTKRVFWVGADTTGAAYEDSPTSSRSSDDFIQLRESQQSTSEGSSSGLT
ncbi:hypothetical protein M5K25_027183 [Dendrobium thyrsiflorum]|uniref:Uncharacterized protein n=1 Tax=Dendrobium thyrsiflorum TaxID=117978 RepID=A0ABD0TZG5_DENTH